MTNIPCQHYRCMRTPNGHDAWIVHISACHDEHITERYFCVDHTLDWIREVKHCVCGLEIIEYLMGDIRTGKEPANPQFYPGEWVAVLRHGRAADAVVAHDPDPAKLRSKLNRAVAHDIYQVEVPW
jgi:hypothetical protein